MRSNNNEREIVIRHIVGFLLPIVLKGDKLYEHNISLL